MECRFEVGQAVVCVLAEWNDTWKDIETPVRGGIYTVRKVVMETLTKDGGEEIVVGILLEEIINPVKKWDRGEPRKREMSFPAIFFKPTRKTDIGVFTNLLETKHDGQLVHETEYEKSKFKKVRKEPA